LQCSQRKKISGSASAFAEESFAASVCTGT
jgi:hypothetical protein